MSNNPIDPAASDELLLIDYLLGRASPEQAHRVEARLQSDDAFRRRKDAVANTFAAIRLLPQAAPPAGLVSRTVALVAQARKTEQSVARRETARPWAVSTFTLKEALAVAASILLLVSVLIPSLRQARIKAMQGQCASNLGQMGTAISAYASENNNLLPAAMDHKEQWLANGTQPVVSNSAALFKLVSANLASVWVFQCPAMGKESVLVQPGMTDFPNSKAIAYSYQHSITPEGQIRRDRFTPSEQESMVIAGDQSPIFADGQFHPDRVTASTSENHGSAGQNVLYLAGYTRFATQPNIGVQGDNIFRSGSLVEYSGNETPSTRVDSFLLPAYSLKP
jgi:type II secretory pathway pseudopilin PulG